MLLKMIGLVIVPHLLYQKIIYKFQLGYSVDYSSNPLLPFHSVLLLSDLVDDEGLGPSLNVQT